MEGPSVSSLHGDVQLLEDSCSTAILDSQTPLSFATNIMTLPAGVNSDQSCDVYFGLLHGQPLEEGFTDNSRSDDTCGLSGATAHTSCAGFFDLLRGATTDFASSASFDDDSHKRHESCNAFFTIRHGTVPRGSTVSLGWSSTVSDDALSLDLPTPAHDWEENNILTSAFRDTLDSSMSMGRYDFEEFSATTLSNGSPDDVSPVMDSGSPVILETPCYVSCATATIKPPYLITHYVAELGELCTLENDDDDSLMNFNIPGDFIAIKPPAPSGFLVTTMRTAEIIKTPMGDDIIGSFDVSSNTRQDQKLTYSTLQVPPPPLARMKSWVTSLFTRSL